MVTGKVLRRHAGGYLVYAEELDVVLQCPLRARLRKEGVDIFTGDRVELEEIEAQNPAERGRAVIAARLERKNLLTRPNVANVDQVIIVTAIHQPEWNGLLCDRYIVHLQLELPAMRPFIAINKVDLASDEEITALRNIYESNGYKLFFLSAKQQRGFDELRESLSGRTSVLSGPSGVGKSSMLNVLNPALQLKVDVNEDLIVGRHTTTYSELYELLPYNDEVPGWIADTPGFSLDLLRHPEPAEVAWEFPELARLAPKCKYGDCLHLGEQGCNVEEHLGEVSDQRMESYRVIVAEAQDEAKYRKGTSQKVDDRAVKYVGGTVERGGRAVPKLNTKYRALSRRKERQQTQEKESEAAEEATWNVDDDLGGE